MKRMRMKSDAMCPIYKIYIYIYIYIFFPLEINSQIFSAGILADTLWLGLTGLFNCCFLSLTTVIMTQVVDTFTVLRKQQLF